MTGGDHTCEVLNDRTAKCWGKNNAGQLGNGISSDSNFLVSVTGLTNLKEISAGHQHTCALLKDGTVQCWGLNQWGQLGNESPYTSPVPLAVNGLTNVKQIASGGHNTCVLLNNGTVNCWGTNQSGQLGHDASLVSTSMSPMKVQNLLNVQAISLGFTHVCALLNNGTVKCWGRNKEGQLGNQATETDALGNPISSSPIVVSELSNVKQISTGSLHTCALLNNGTVKCWGWNGYGQLGNESIEKMLMATLFQVSQLL